MDSKPAPRKRGRPPKAPADQSARHALIQSGLRHLTERGYSSVSLDEILRDAGVPKGGFYYYFSSKTEFGLELVRAYDSYFTGKLDKWLLNKDLNPLDRIRHFTIDAEAGMARYDYKRGCLVGNLGQEMGALPEAFRDRLIGVLDGWANRTAICLEAAQNAQEIAAHHNTKALADMFWIGWEGAVLRAKLDRSPDALRQFADQFFILISNEGTTQ